MQNKTVSVYLPDVIIEALDEIGKAEDRNRSYIIQKAVKEYANNHGFSYTVNKEE